MELDPCYAYKNESSPFSLFVFGHIFGIAVTLAFQTFVYPQFAHYLKLPLKLHYLIMSKREEVSVERLFQQTTPPAHVLTKMVSKSVINEPWFSLFNLK